jgi:phosphoheptose isomerase
MWQQMQSSFQKYPTSFAVWANQFQLQHIFPKEITLLGDKADLFYQQIYTDSYRPNILFITNKMFDAKLNLIANQSKTNEMIFRLCQENVCLPQFDKLDDLLLAIK